jgi:hypothetical protein
MLRVPPLALYIAIPRSPVGYGVGVESSVEVVTVCTKLLRRPVNIIQQHYSSCKYRNTYFVNTVLLIMETEYFLHLFKIIKRF